MKELKVKKWQATGPDGSVEENTILLLKVIVGLSTEQLPKGMDGFGLMRRLSEAFDKAEKEGKLVLEDNDYKMLKEYVEKNIPAKWASNPNIVAVVEEFLSIR
jgi:hypothetical protein